LKKLRREKSQKMKSVKNVKPASGLAPAPRKDSFGNGGMFPVGIKYAEEKEDDSPFSAVAVLPRNLPPALTNSDEICIFSQERLCDCEQLGAIVYSCTKKGSLKWQYVCNPKAKFSDQNPKGVHLFDTNYLKDWVARKGTKFIQCPLCKQGAEVVKKIGEHEIDSLEQMKEKRTQAKKSNDVPLQFFTEQLILAKVCETKWTEDANRAREQEETLRDVLRHWSTRRKIVEFFPKIQDGLKKAVAKDITGVARILITALKETDKAKKVTTAMLTLAATHNAFDCATLICEQFLEDVEFEPRPSALLAAIKQMNVGLIELLMKHMASKNRQFIGDDCFKETIKRDMVEVAKQIIILRWHKPTDEDFKLCEKIEGNMLSYLKSRKMATEHPMPADEDMLALDDDDWDVDDSDGGLDEDDWGED